MGTTVAPTLSPSRYNFWASTDWGTHLLFNGLTGGLLEFDPEERTVVTAILTGTAAFAGSHVVATLTAGGFLVRDGIDEARLLIERNRHTTEHHGVFELTVSPTYQCNFRCTYCYVDFENQRMTAGVADRVADFVDRELPRYGHANITWFGGEPLLCLDTVLPLVRRLRDVGQAHDLEVLQFLTSNGYLLTPTVAAELGGAGIRYFHITIDGGRRHHDERRVLAGHRPSFDRVHGNCLGLLAALREAHLTLRMNVDTENIASVDEVLTSIPSVDRHRVQVHITPILWGASDRPPRPLLAAVNAAIRRALELGFGYYDNIIRPARKTFCSADRRGNFHVGPDGRLHKCSPSGKPEVCVGSLGPGGLPIFNERFDTWHGAGPAADACVECPYLCFCAGGCRLTRVRREPNPGCRDRYANLDQLIINSYLASSR